MNVQGEIFLELVYYIHKGYCQSDILRGHFEANKCTLCV